MIADQAHAEASSVIPVNPWTVLALVLLVFLAYALSAWAKHRGDADARFAKQHRIETRR